MGLDRKIARQPVGQISSPAASGSAGPSSLSYPAKAGIQGAGSQARSRMRIAAGMMKPIQIGSFRLRIGGMLAQGPTINPQRPVAEPLMP
jgi:hypothetical protein